MIGFWVVNLLIPDEPKEVKIGTTSGEWLIDKYVDYDKSADAIRNNQCAHTNSIQHPASLNKGGVDPKVALQEMTPLMLGASYLTGLSVTAKK